MKGTSKKLKKKGSFFQREGTYWILILVILLAIPVVNVYTKAILSETNIQLEEIQNKIQNQKNTNDSLKMEISELASLDTIQEIAYSNGLQYQNNNIKVVTED